MSLDIKSITDKVFWKTVKSLFSDKQNHHRKITLLENNEILSNDSDVAETMNTLFLKVFENLEIEGYYTDDFSFDMELDNISNIITKFNDHPSILKIK